VASHQLYLAHSRALELQLFSFALTVSRTLSCARASARAVPSAASLQLYLAHYRALELQHARCPLRLRIKCISRTPVHSSFSTRGALCGFALKSRALSCTRASARISCISRTLVHSSFSFASAVSRALSCTRASARAVPAVASHQLYLAHSRALELQHAWGPLQLRFNCVSHTLVRSSFSTRGAPCGFASTVCRALSCTRASARAVPSAASH
jgi:hypothetical protein